MAVSKIEKGLIKLSADKAIKIENAFNGKVTCDPDINWSVSAAVIVTGAIVPIQSRVVTKQKAKPLTPVKMKMLLKQTGTIQPDDDLNNGSIGTIQYLMFIRLLNL